MLKIYGTTITERSQSTGHRATALPFLHVNHMTRGSMLLWRMYGSNRNKTRSKETKH